jgi:hypothetical protein
MIHPGGPDTMQLGLDCSSLLVRLFSHLDVPRQTLPDPLSVRVPHALSSQLCPAALLDKITLMSTIPNISSDRIDRPLLPAIPLPPPHTLHRPAPSLPPWLRIAPNDARVREK